MQSPFYEIQKTNIFLVHYFDRAKIISIFKRSASVLLTFTFMGLIGFAFNAKPIIAQEESEATEMDALSGFDDETTEAADDDVMSGFNDSDESNDSDYTVDSEQSGDETESWSSLSGSFGLNSSYSYQREAPTDKTQADWSGLTKLQSYLTLTWDAKLGGSWRTRISGKGFYDLAFSLKDRDTYSKEVLEELEQEAEFREVYIEGNPFGNLDIKIGKQIVAWGVASSLRTVDVLNPTDNREFGMTDLEDIRQPITMTRLDYYLGDIQLQAVGVHEITFNKTAPYGSDYNPATQQFDEIIPESTSENMEYGIAIIGTFSGWDASLHWADYYDDTPHFNIKSIAIIPGVGAVPTFEQKHSRLKMAGATLSIPSGNFLWKMAGARLQGMEFAWVTDKTFTRSDVLLGTEYSGWTDTQVTLELGLQHLNDFDVTLEAAPNYQLEDRLATSLILVQDYLNQTLHLNMVGMMIGKAGKDGAINRASLEYDLADAFSILGGLIAYQTGESIYFQSISPNDRIFFEAKYSF